MSKIKNSGFDKYALNRLNSSDLEQLALKGLSQKCVVGHVDSH